MLCLALALILAVSMGGSIGVARASGPIYRYIDARGVLHFSDAPVDDRYRRLKSASQEGLAIPPHPVRDCPSTRATTG